MLYMYYICEHRKGLPVKTSQVGILLVLTPKRTPDYFHLFANLSTMMHFAALISQHCWLPSGAVS